MSILTDSFHSYPKIYNVGHKNITDILTGNVLIEEKIDGSQFSWGKFGDELRIRSRGVIMDPDHPEKMFSKAVETVKKLFPLLKDDYTYRAEYLQKPGHNSLVYDRIPKDHLIIFDVNPVYEGYLSYEEKKAEAERLGLEVVPKLFEGTVENLDMFLDFLKQTSILGGQLIEGVVIKAYDKFGGDKKVLMGKYVSEKFKEVHASKWKLTNPTGGDIIDELINELRTPARWDKAIQHLKESDLLTNTPKDIGSLMAEITKDTLDEQKEYISGKLYAWAKKRIGRGVTLGFPEYYKKKLLESNFNTGELNE